MGEQTGNNAGTIEKVRAIEGKELWIITLILRTLACTCVRTYAASSTVTLPDQYKFVDRFMSFFVREPVL